MDDETTTFADQEPQYSQQQYNPYSQPDFNQQSNPYVQQSYNQNIYQQPNPYEQQGYAQQNFNQQQYNPYMQQGYNQNFNQQPNPYAQQGYNQNFNQQPNPYAQQGYNQSFNQQPDAAQNVRPQKRQSTPKDKSESRGISKNILISVISSVVSIAVLVVFFLVILPAVKGDKIKGSYEGKTYWIVLEDGVYNLGYMDGSYAEVGTYELDGNKLTLTYAGGDKENAIVMDYSSDKIKSSDDTLKVDDANELLPFEPDAKYIDNIEDTIQQAAEDALSDSDVKDEVGDSKTYTIKDDSLAKPATKFEEQLADKLDYEGNEILQYMFEKASTSLVITIDGSDVTVDMF
jgi:hypothetical protein